MDRAVLNNKFNDLIAGVFCHSGLEPESSGFKLDSRFRGNDKVAKSVFFIEV
jgi:hypothetical protein